MSRTDSIGDVILTLPMAGLLKQFYPNCKIYFLGRTYTQEVIALSEYIDGFIDYTLIEKLKPGEQKEEIKKLNADIFVHVFPVKEIAKLAKAAGIKYRVGTTNRVYHWTSCNKLIKLSRKNSNLHESQLNLKLLSVFDFNTDISLQKVDEFYGFTKIPRLNSEYSSLIDSSKFNLILHPKSKGSAVEWGLQNFTQLISILPKNKYKIFVSGTLEEGKLLEEFIKNNSDIIDLTGKLSLQQFIAFINSCDGLIAASTGPLHIAAALNKTAIGLFSSRKPIHPGRWQPIGKNAHALVFDDNCQACKAKKKCNCIQKITPEQIVQLLK